MLRSRGLRGSTSSRPLNVWRSALHLLGRRALREAPRSTNNMRDVPPSKRSEVGAIPFSMFVLAGLFTLATCADSWNRRACRLTTAALFSHQTLEPSGAAPGSSIHTRALAKHPGTNNAGACVLFSQSEWCLLCCCIMLSLAQQKLKLQLS